MTDKKYVSPYLTELVINDSTPYYNIQRISPNDRPDIRYSIGCQKIEGHYILQITTWPGRDSRCGGSLTENIGIAHSLEEAVKKLKPEAERLVEEVSTDPWRTIRRIQANKERRDK